MDERDRELVTQYLASREVSCPACGYALTDLPGGNCPECGLALELRLGLVQPRQFLYVWGLVSLGAGAGFHALIGLYFLYGIFTWGGPGWSDALPLLVGVVVEVPLLVLWVKSWGFMQQRTRTQGFALGLGCTLLTVGTALWFFGWVD